MPFKAFEVKIMSFFSQETKLTNSSAVWRYLIGYKVLHVTRHPIATLIHRFWEMKLQCNVIRTYCGPSRTSG